MSKFEFKNLVMVKGYTDFDWNIRPGAWDTVQQLMQPAIKVTKQDVLKDMPPVTYSYRYIPMSPQQKAFYTELEKQQTFTLDSGTSVTAVHAASLYTKLAQIASGCVYDEDRNPILFDVKARVTEMLDLISQTNEAVLVFAPFRHTLAMLEPYLLPLGFKVIHGDVKNRGEIIDELQNGKIKGILATPSTMSHGITCTAANLTIWFAPCDKAEVYLQATARMNRPGQKNAMSIVHLFGSTAERKIYTALQEQAKGQSHMLSLFSSLFKET
jgi:SNF2 family DNA or RNA helicase